VSHVALCIARVVLRTRPSDLDVVCAITARNGRDAGASHPAICQEDRVTAPRIFTLPIMRERGAVQLATAAAEGLVARPGGRAAYHLPSVTASRGLQIAPAERLVRRGNTGAPLSRGAPESPSQLSD
jgi:hypothetical protein